MLAQFEHIFSPGWTIFIIQSTWFEASAKPCGAQLPTLARVACVCQCANGGGSDVYMRLVRVCWGWKCRQLKYLSVKNRSPKATKIRLQNRKRINNKKPAKANESTTKSARKQSVGWQRSLSSTIQLHTLSDRDKYPPGLADGVPIPEASVTFKCVPVGR